MKGCSDAMKAGLDEPFTLGNFQTAIAVIQGMHSCRSENTFFA
jgi:hypothetical protein